MADIKATGIDVVSGVNKPIESADTLITNNISATSSSNITIEVGDTQQVNLDLGSDTLSHTFSGFEIIITGTGANPIFIGSGDAPTVDTDGKHFTLSAGSANGIGQGGDLFLATGSGDTDDKLGKFRFDTPYRELWLMEQGFADPDYGEHAMFRGATDDSLVSQASILQGCGGFPGERLVIRGGAGEGDPYSGGAVYVTGGTGAVSGGEAGQVFIGSYLHTDNGIGGFTTGTRGVVIGAETNPAQTVEIYNFSAPTAQIGAGNNDTQQLILLQNGYLDMGSDTVAPMYIGPVYYDPNNGEVIRMGNTLACIYLVGDETNNFIRGGDGGEELNVTLFRLPGGPATYDLVDNSIAPPSPIEPGSVIIRGILSGATTFSDTTDDGAGNFPVSALLPAGGTVNYTTGDLTGVTDTLDTKTQVVAFYSRANAAGEPLTPKGGDGVGTGAGGELRLRGGAGGATAAGGDIGAIAGAGGSTSGNAGGISLAGGTPVDGHGGSISLTGSNGVGTNRNGGDITISAGAKTGTGLAGDVALRSTAQGLSTIVDRYFINATSKALTNTTATSIFTATVASNSAINGEVKLGVRADDATDFQATTVSFTYAAVNKAGTVTSQVTLNTGNTATIASTGTLTVTATALNGAGIITLQITATSSLTPTTLDATYQVINNSGQTITVV